jgi:hypothetical protein
VVVAIVAELRRRQTKQRHGQVQQSTHTASEKPLSSNALRYNRRQANLNGRSPVSIPACDAERAGSALEGRLDLIPAKTKTQLTYPPSLPSPSFMIAVRHEGAEEVRK